MESSGWSSSMNKGELVTKLRDEGHSNAGIAALMNMPEPSVRRLISEWRSAHDPDWAETPASRPTRIVFIPDTQCRPDDDLGFLTWAGEYIATQEPDVIIHAGDHYDMASLSSYEQRGSKYFEGKRYLADIAAGNEGWERLEEGLQKRSVPSWKPKRDYLLGNHEQRIERAVQADPRLEGVIGYEGFNAEKLGWEMHPFLKVVERGGVAFAHYFYNPNTGRAYAGSVDTMLRNIGFSFAMGHQQGLRYARRELNNGTVQVGLVAGSFYEHNEEYRGHQAQSEWRGLIVMHEVRDGNYDLMQVSMDYLRRKFSQ